LTVKSIFKPYFGALKLAELDMMTIRRAWADLSDRLAPSSIRVHHKTLSGCLRLAVEANLIPANPCSNWRGRGLPKVAHQETPALNPQQPADLINAARDHAVYAAVILAAGSGARRAEISALTWADIDMRTGVLTISKAHKQLSQDNIITGPPKGGRT